MYQKISIAIVLLLIVWIIGSYVAIRDLEEPKYTVLEKRNGYEIRQYESYIIAETEVPEGYQEGLSSGFRVIADYIFGNNTTKSSIAMTAPVLESTPTAGDMSDANTGANTSEQIAMTVPVINTVDSTSNNTVRRTVSFVLPSKYTLETLPKPNNTAVTLREVPGRKVAARRFTWYATESRIASQKKRLMEKLSADGVVTVGVSQVAQYNPPISFPLTRRNEILVQILITEKSVATSTETVEGENSATNDGAISAKTGTYEAYSADKVARAETGDVVIFFHASWCPSCRSLSSNIEKNAASIPSTLTILKASYDSEKELKKKYGVTSQHTLVQVDASGTMIKKWSGGGTLQSVISQLQ